MLKSGREQKISVTVRTDSTDIDRNHRGNPFQWKDFWVPLGGVEETVDASRTPRYYWVNFDNDFRQC